MALFDGIEFPPRLIPVAADFQRGSVSSRGGDATSSLPSKARRNEKIWRSYFGAMELLCDDLLKGFSLALDLDNEEWFQDKTNRHASSLRSINYPEVGKILRNEILLSYS